MGERFALTHLHQRFSFKTSFTFLRRRKIKERHFRILIPFGVNDFSESIDTRIWDFDHGDRRFTFFLKPADLGTEAGKGVKDGSFSSARESN